MTTTTNSTVRATVNVLDTSTGMRGACIRIAGDTAVVLVRDTGKLARLPLANLVPTRGRPVKLVGGLHRADVDELIADNAAFRVAAVRELFGRQTADERDVLATRWDNSVGFRADDARRGSTLAGKAACAWTEADHATAANILSVYSGTQLWDLASHFLSDTGVNVETHNISESEALVADILADLLADAS